MPESIEPQIHGRRRALLRSAAGLALASAAGRVPAQAGADRTEPPAIGARIALPATRLLDGRELAPAYWRNKVLVVELWATWCPFCKRQNPYLDQLHRTHADSGLEVLALSIDRRPEEVRRYLREHGYAFHVAMFEPRWQAAIGRPKGLPILWVIGRDARLRQLGIGEMFPEDIEELARWRTT